LLGLDRAAKHLIPIVSSDIHSTHIGRGGTMHYLWRGARRGLLPWSQPPFPSSPSSKDIIMNGLLKGEYGRDGIILLSRVLLMLLFLIFGWEKLTGFGGTVALFTKMGVPMPTVATAIAILAEGGIGLLLLVGLLTRPFAILMGIYTLATAFIGHHYWNIAGPERIEAEIGFYKNVSIMGGLLLLYITGAGRYSLDHKLKL
jgi:putative oxidoreductase